MARRKEPVVAFFPSRAAALEARRSLRELDAALRLIKLGNIAIVHRPSDDVVEFHQDGDVDLPRGATFGLVAGALLSAVLLAPFAGLLASLGMLGEIDTSIDVVAITEISAIVSALISGLVVLLGALGGALLGGLAAALINLGIPTRELRSIGGDLEIGRAALVLRIHEWEIPPVVADMQLHSGTLMRPTAAAFDVRAGASASPAARFTAMAQQSSSDELIRRYMPASMTEAPVDPRQKDLVIGSFYTVAQARRARRKLRSLDRRHKAVAIGNIALINKDEEGRISFQQTENVGPVRGLFFGMLIGGLVSALAFGIFGALLSAAFTLADPAAEVSDTALLSASLGGALVFAIIFGALGLLMGAVVGASTATVLNLAYSDQDLRRIGAGLPSGRSLLVTLVHHHGVPQVVDAIEKLGGTVPRTPVPLNELAIADQETVRANAAEKTATNDSSADTERLITTHSGVRIFADWHRRGPHTIVLLHGAGGDHLAWRVQYPALHAAGYSTLAIDLRGHGYSDRPLRAADYSLERVATDVYEVLQALEIDDFIIVGHCFGGMVATMFHQAHPDLSKGYLLLDTAARAPGLPAWIARNAPWAINATGKLLEFLPGERRRLLHADMQAFRGTGDIEPLRLISDAEHTTLRSWMLIYRGIAQYDGVESLKTMHQPVWVVVGAEDTVFTVEDSKFIQQHVPGSKLVTVPGANHIIVVNNPEAVEKLILSFIADHAIFPAGEAVAPAADAKAAGEAAAPAVINDAKHDEEAPVAGFPVDDRNEQERGHAPTDFVAGDADKTEAGFFGADQDEQERDKTGAANTDASGFLSTAEDSDRSQEGSAFLADDQERHADAEAGSTGQQDEESPGLTERNRKDET